jgi:hypothetical protein
LSPEDAYLRLVWLMRFPEASLANLVVHVDVHTESFGGVLIMMTTLVIGFTLSSYIMLVGNIMGRLMAAKEIRGFLDAPKPRRGVAQTVCRTDR